RVVVVVLPRLQPERVRADEGACLGIVVAKPVVVEAALVVGGLPLEAGRRGGCSRIVGGELAEGAALEGIGHLTLGVDQRLWKAVVGADLEEPLSVRGRVAPKTKGRVAREAPAPDVEGLVTEGEG